MAILKSGAQSGNPAPDARRTGRRRRAARGLAILIAACFVHEGLRAQAVNEYELKAAFLYNFAKFVEWPDDAFASAADPISVCLLGGNPFGDLLQRTVAGKSVQGHGFSVGQISAFPSGHSCHIVFVAGESSKLLRDFEKDGRHPGVLTVGEAPDFTERGGMIGFKLEHGTVHLHINLAAVEAAQVRISSKLLSLAKIVRKSP